MMNQLLRPFDGARDSLRELSARGMPVVLATSAPPHELKTFRQLLDVEDAVEAVTSADDVESAKPIPKLCPSLSNAPGVVCIGVTTGGLHATELREAGAVANYESVAGLLDDLDGSLLAGR